MSLPYQHTIKAVLWQKEPNKFENKKSFDDYLNQTIKKGDCDKS